MSLEQAVLTSHGSLHLVVKYYEVLKVDKENPITRGHSFIGENDPI